MRCNHCGSELSMGQTFCEQCKIDLADDAAWFTALLDQAKAGNAEAQGLIGKIYLTGSKTVQQDYAQAKVWFEKASLQNDGTGLYGLGIFHLRGWGDAPTDAAKALEYAERSVQQGSLDGMRLMGILYQEGFGVPQNYAEACRWYRMAADKDNADAMCNLGWMCENGHGAKKNEAEALRWYRMAADKGNAYSMNIIGWWYKEGHGVPQNDTEACRWYRMAADKDNANAMCNLGWMYNQGRGVLQNDTEACRWYRLAADYGSVKAMLNLGLSYEDGSGVPQNDTEACRWYRMAADKDNADAMFSLGWMYNQGRGVKKNDGEACRWYRMAADNGNVDAMNYLGELYQYGGKGIRKDETEARRWYQMAADKGNALAIKNLALLEEAGLGGQKNLVSAKARLREAAEKDPAQYCELALLHERQNNYDEALQCWIRYYEKNKPLPVIVSDSDNWAEYINSHFMNEVYPQIESAQEKLMYRSPCIVIFNHFQDKRVSGGHSHTTHYGAYGRGYYTLTDRCIYINTSASLTQKYLKFDEYKDESLSCEKIISDSSLCISLDKIKDYSITGYKGRCIILNAGASTFIGDYNFENDIPYIVAAINQARQSASAVTQPQAAESDGMAKLKKLKDLLDAGVLTQAEYEERRNKVLAEMGL